MTATPVCDLLAENLGSYVDGASSPEEAQRINSHLSYCDACRETVRQFRAVKSLIEYLQLTPTAEELPLDVATKVVNLSESFSSRLHTRLGAAPWWFVSASMHFLIIALAGLVSMAVEIPRSDSAVVMITDLQPRPARIEGSEISNQNFRDVMSPPTDLQSKQFSDTIVPPDIRALANLDEHFESVNPDVEDKHNASGDVDALSFHAVSGSIQASGGGGMGSLGIEDLIGSDGSSSCGSGSGFVGGDGLGNGCARGTAKGTFGNRFGSGRKLLVKRGDGSPETESAVEKALEWLARNQEQDGHWDATKLEATCRAPEWAEVGMTGIATLAFLGAGNSEKVGKYKDTVGRALHWLLDKQVKTDGREKGRWVTVMYANGLATMALAEAYGMGSHTAEMKMAVQNAVHYIEEAQHPYMAWDYYSFENKRNDRNDTSVSIWLVMALKDAKTCGFKVNPLAFEGALNWLNVGQDLPNDAEGKYDFEGGMMAYAGTRDGLEYGRTQSMTAVAAMMRIFIGQKMDHPGIVGPCNLMKIEKPKPIDKPINPGECKWMPAWVPMSDIWGKDNPNSGINFYYWYYGTFSMFQMGGEHWKIWNEHLKSTLLPMQRKDGVFEGSWDPIGRGKVQDGGRVFSTALGAMCLEVYYRYAKFSQN